MGNEIIKTKSISVFNMCVPCGCHCKYCLLSYERKLEGIDYDKGIDYAQRFQDWMLKFHSDVSFNYYFGYSMETPKLFDSIEILQKLNSPIAKFLQFNGMKIRKYDELKNYLLKLKEIGIEMINTTFYGVGATHDQFADRKGDYEYLLEVLKVSKEIDLKVEVTISITKENACEIDTLLDDLEGKYERIFGFIPHCGGKGISMDAKRLSLDDYNKMSNKVKKILNRDRYKTQEEWLNSKPEKVRWRVLTLSLLPSNIKKIESQSFEETYRQLEEMDETFYSRIPSFNQMLELYVDKEDNGLYSQKDLYAHYRKKYIADNNLEISDIDERYSYSQRL